MSKQKDLMISGVRCVYPTLVDPKPFPGQDEKSVKYGIKILIPKENKGQLSAVKEYIKAAIEAADWTKAVKAAVYKTATDQDPYNDLCIIKDGDALNVRRVDEGKDALDAYAGCVVVSLSKKLSFGPPSVVDQNAKEIPPMNVQAEIRGGYWVNVAASAYCYSKPKTGCSLQLVGVQKVREDVVFGAANPFQPLEDAANPFDEQIPL